VTTAPCLEPIGVCTVELTGADAERAGRLLDILPNQAPLAWVRNGEGMVGWGEAARFVVSGRDRFARAIRWWDSLVANAAVLDDLRLPGTGPVVFGSFAFADGPTPSVLVLPRTLVGRRDGRTWVTAVGLPDGDLKPSELAPVPAAPARVRYADGALSSAGWRDAVAQAVGHIRAGELSKVVLARDLIAFASDPIDQRHLLAGLAARYPSCFTFAVHGLVGATPELLVRRMGRSVLSRVLAGTAWRHAGGAGAAPETAEELVARLLGSPKDREEHEYAAASAAESLRPYCTDLHVPATPEVLALANVAHLATDVTGTLADDTTALALAGALHPTAAVCGWPRAAAAELISALEHMDRGRYAGPVGWMDATGDGEWGLALRCGEVEGSRLRLFAGCGIVAGSDPDTEVAEAQAKFVAVRDALEA
jgi:menaquinone-specific isochorismate synthase